MPAGYHVSHTTWAECVLDRFQPLIESKPEWLEGDRCVMNEGVFDVVGDLVHHRECLHGVFAYKAES